MKNFFKKTKLLLITILFASIPFSFVLGYNNLSGLILLQVEENGEAWYVKPGENKRAFLNRPADAFKIMKEFGLGIKSSELDYYLENSFPERLIGQILLDVERNGEAYYIYPKDKKAYFLNRPSDAFEIMRSLSLGIINSDLEKIDVLEILNNNEKEDLPENINTLDEFINKTESSQQLVDSLNKYFYLEERGGYIAKEAEEFFNDRSGNQFDFLVFASHVLNKKLNIVGLIRYEYSENSSLKSNLIVTFRDKDDVARQILFNGNKVELEENGNSFRSLIRHHESKLDININRWAYFPPAKTDLSEPIHPFTWQN